MATIDVTLTADSGANTLRQAIIDLNAQSGSHIITFSGAAVGTTLVPAVISLASALPALTKSMTIIGPGLSLLTINGNNLYRVFNLNASLTFSISGLKIANGRAATSVSPNYLGGGIYNAGSNLTINNCYFTGCYAGYTTSGVGGAIYHQNGSLTVTNTSFVSNTAVATGSGIYSAGTGVNSVSIGNCTFSSNSGSAYNGNSVATIYNCTFYNNTGVMGAAIVAGNNGNFTILSSTISGNTSSGGTFQHKDGAVYQAQYCSLTLKNTIITGTTGQTDFGAYDTSTIPISKIANIVSSAYNWTSDVSAASLGTLGALQNNNGSLLQTIAVPAGSSAIGAGNSTATNASPVSGLDQTGATRSVTAPTIGALEYTFVLPNIDFPASPVVGQTYSFYNIMWIWNGIGWKKVNNDPSTTIFIANNFGGL
jgi:hypothetical protein